MKTSTFLWSLMVSLTAASAVAQPTITDLGVLSGGVNSEAFGLNTDGSVVVGVSQSAEGDRAFRWTPFAGMVSLGTVNGDSTVASGVSDDGNVITGSSTNANGGIAFRWTPASGIAALGTLPGGQLSYGFGVSGNGAVLVGYSYAPARGYRWTQAGGMQNLGTLPGASRSDARGVSWDGSAVAGYTFTSFPGHAARWTLSAGWQDLGALNQGDASVSYAISGNGQAVVGEDWVPGQYPGHAFRWTPGSGMQDLGTVPGGTSSVARGANWDGSIVVGDSQGWAMRWTASTGMVDLNNWLPSQGVDLTDWVLLSARAVSPDGSAIAGRGIRNGVMRAWVVTGLPGSSTVTPTSYSLFRGVTVSGNLNSLSQSDNNRLVLRPGVVFVSQEPPIQLIINGTSPFSSPTRLEFSVEGHCNASNITQSISLWNFDTQSYETLSSTPVTTVDSQNTIICILKGQYIGPNLEVKARVSYKANGPTFVYPWQARIDQVKWRIMD